MPTKEDWQEIRENVSGLLQRHSGALGTDTQASVRHYLDHDEYEMAFEGLCLDLMAKGVQKVDWEACVAMGRRLGLDTHSTFDGDFWIKLNQKLVLDPS